MTDGSPGMRLLLATFLTDWKHCIYQYNVPTVVSIKNFSSIFYIEFYTVFSRADFLKYYKQPIVFIPDLPDHTVAAK